MLPFFKDISVSCLTEGNDKFPNFFPHYAIVLQSAMLLVPHRQAPGNRQPPSNEAFQTSRLSESINDPCTQLAEEVTTWDTRHLASCSHRKLSLESTLSSSQCLTQEIKPRSPRSRRMPAWRTTDFFTFVHFLFAGYQTHVHKHKYIK